MTHVEKKVQEILEQERQELDNVIQELLERVEVLEERLDERDQQIKWLEDQMFAMNRARTDEINALQYTLNAILIEMERKVNGVNFQ
jgi:Zn-dependent oligopeptidase